jgi:hypothetical protein
MRVAARNKVDPLQILRAGPPQAYAEIFTAGEGGLGTIENFAGAGE